jgi:hypothetical protein
MGYHRWVGALAAVEDKLGTTTMGVERRREGRGGRTT